MKLNLEKLLSVEAVYDNASAKGSSDLDIDSIQGVHASKKNNKGIKGFLLVFPIEVLKNICNFEIFVVIVHSWVNLVL